LTLRCDWIYYVLTCDTRSYYAVTAEKARRKEIAYTLALSAYSPLQRAKKRTKREQNKVCKIGVLPGCMLLYILRMVFNEKPRATIEELVAEHFSSD
jgi:hypothetical protein